jgi:hypothetical protein
MDELRERLYLAIVGTAEARCADDGDGYTDVWVTNIEPTVDAILAEITKDHAIVPLAAADAAMRDPECGDAVDRVVYGAGFVWLGNSE